MKTAEGYLAEANAVVPKIAVEDAIARHATGEACLLMCGMAKILPRAAQLQAHCISHADLLSLLPMMQHHSTMPPSARMLKLFWCARQVAWLL